MGVRGNRDPSVGISTFPLFILFGSRATNIHSAEISPSICSRVSRHRSMASSKLSYHGTTMDRVGAGMGHSLEFCTRLTRKSSDERCGGVALDPLSAPPQRELHCYRFSPLFRANTAHMAKVTITGYQRQAVLAGSSGNPNIVVRNRPPLSSKLNSDVSVCGCCSFVAGQ